ncbi:MAG: hypothetical protein ACOCXT_00095 [Candidatus Dojkabacteria bacterium]
MANIYGDTPEGSLWNASQLTWEIPDRTSPPRGGIVLSKLLCTGLLLCACGSGGAGQEAAEVSNYFSNDFGRHMAKLLIAEERGLRMYGTVTYLEGQGLCTQAHVLTSMEAAMNEYDAEGRMSSVQLAVGVVIDGQPDLLRFDNRVLGTFETFRAPDGQEPVLCSQEMGNDSQVVSSMSPLLVVPEGTQLTTNNAVLHTAPDPETFLNGTKILVVNQSSLVQERQPDYEFPNAPLFFLVNFLFPEGLDVPPTVCTGDSGAPILVTLEDGSLVVIAMVNAGETPDGYDCTSTSVATTSFFK